MDKKPNEMTKSEYEEAHSSQRFKTDDMGAYLSLGIIIVIVGVLVAYKFGYKLPTSAIIGGMFFMVALTIPFLDTRH